MKGDVYDRAYNTLSRNENMCGIDPEDGDPTFSENIESKMSTRQMSM
jgi:hypothetical protein